MRSMAAFANTDSLFARIPRVGKSRDGPVGLVDHRLTTPACPAMMRARRGDHDCGSLSGVKRKFRVG